MSLEIYLCQPRRAMRKIMVPEEALVADLLQLYPCQKNSFIYKGIVLCSNMKISAYGVQNNDQIIVLPDIVVDAIESKFHTKVFEHGKRLFASANPSIICELARLKDIKYAKMELKPNRLQLYYNSFMAEDSRRSFESVTNIPDKTTLPPHPSCEPLPCPWLVKKSHAI